MPPSKPSIPLEDLMQILKSPAAKLQGEAAASSSQSGGTPPR